MLYYSFIHEYVPPSSSFLRQLPMHLHQFGHTVDIPQAIRPESLDLPLFVAFACPVYGKLLRRCSMFGVGHGRAPPLRSVFVSIAHIVGSFQNPLRFIDCPDGEAR